MQLRTKMLIDSIGGWVLVRVLNVTAFMLGKILHRDHSLSKDVRVVVVSKLMGIGSIIQSTPLLESLRLHFPNTRLIYFTRSANVDIVRMYPMIDEVVMLEDRSLVQLMRSLAAAVARFWSLGIDLYFNLEVFSNIGGVCALVSCARNRLGFYSDHGDFRRLGIYTHMVYFNSLAPRSQTYLQLLRAAGIPNVQERIVAPTLTESARHTMERKLESLTLGNRSLVLINPNSSEFGVERRWPGERFARLIELIAGSQRELTIALVGSTSERAFVEEIVGQVNSGAEMVRNLSGVFTLAEYAWLLKKAELFVTIDSGPMHLASALGVRTLALFGIETPDHYYSEDNSVHFVYKGIYCSPCAHRFNVPPCGGDNQCMKSIAVEDVFNAMRSLMAGEESAPSATRHLEYSGRDRVYGLRSRGHQQ